MVDIILTYYHTDFLLEKCLSRLLSTDYKDFCIHIVDNTLSSESYLNKFKDSRINTIRGISCRTTSEHSRGKQHPQGILHGINSTNSEYIVLTEADCWPLKNDWLSFCIDQLNSGVSLIGIQDPGSLPITFQAYKREKLNQYSSFSYLRKPSYISEDLSLISCPEIITKVRHKWRYGEYLPLLMHRNKEKTLGFLPTKVCFPKEWRTEISDITGIFTSSLGVIYGNMIFHCCKSYRKSETVKNNIDYFLSDSYLTETKQLYKEEYVINNGRYENCFYNNFV